MISDGIPDGEAEPKPFAANSRGPCASLRSGRDDSVGRKGRAIKKGPDGAPDLGDVSVVVANSQVLP